MGYSIKDAGPIFARFSLLSSRRRMFAAPHRLAASDCPTTAWLLDNPAGIPRCRSPELSLASEGQSASAERGTREADGNKPRGTVRCCESAIEISEAAAGRDRPLGRVESREHGHHHQLEADAAGAAIQTKANGSV